MSIFFGMKLDKNRRNILSRRKGHFFWEKMKLWKFTKSLSRRKGHFFGKISNARLWAVIPQKPTRPRREGVHTPYPDPYIPLISAINGSIFSL